MISCIIPACNEAGQLAKLINQVNEIEKISEIFIVEGGSKDNTWQVAIQMQENYPKKVYAIKQSGRGKFNAVLEGAAASNERFIMIWDADATVSLKSSLELIEIVGKQDQFIMGDRLKGENEKKSFLPPIFVSNQEVSEENKKSPKNKLVYQFISFESTALDEVLK